VVLKFLDPKGVKSSCKILLVSGSTMVSKRFSRL